MENILQIVQTLFGLGWESNPHLLPLHIGQIQIEVECRQL